jgi:glycerol-3-phosphate dehydrogenase
MNDTAALRLVRLYGAEAEQVLALGADSLVAAGSVLSGEVAWALQKEGAQNLEDVVYRRTRAALYQPEEAAAILPRLAELMGAELGWTEDKKTREIVQVKALLNADKTSLLSAVA